MPCISKNKKDRIAEQILHYLFTVSPAPKFTSAIAEEIARDEEFVKSLLKELHSKKLVREVSKNASGIAYSRRKRWLLTNDAYLTYRKHQAGISP